MPPPAHRTHHQRTFALLATGIGAFALLQSLVVPALPVFQQSMGTSQAAVTWMLTAYLLSASVCTPIIGRLGDMKGKKRLFVITLIVLGVGTVLSAFATTLPIMIVGRVIQGMGGGLLPLAFGIIRDEFPSEKVPNAIGSMAALTAVGIGFGIVLAGPIVDLLSYHWLFWFPMILIVTSTIGTALLVPESRVRAAGRINWTAAVLLSVWLVALLLAISQAPTWGWLAPGTLGLLGCAVVVAALWVAVEARSAHPLIDLRMMTIRAVWTTNLVALLFGMATYGTFGFLPAFLHTSPEAGYGFAAPVSESGLMLLPQAIMMLLLGMCAGRLAQLIGSRTVLMLGAAMAIAPFLMLVFFNDQKWQIYLATAFLGIAMGMAFAAMANLIVQAVPPDQTGVASGMNANIRTIGGALGTALMATIVTAGVAPGGVPEAASYDRGWSFLCLATALSVAAGFLIPRFPAPPGGTEPDVELRHAELAIVAGGTVVGDDPE
ncbi:MAG: MFS transporter [Actinomycetota bacterium]|nr:MAG: MFS transporter [Actinomycetota bacterium]